MHSNWLSLITPKTGLKLMTRLVLFTPKLIFHDIVRFSGSYWNFLLLLSFPLWNISFLTPTQFFSELYWFLKILLVHLLWLIKYKFCMLIQSDLLSQQVERNWQIIALTIRLMVDFCFTSPPRLVPRLVPPSYVL